MKILVANLGSTSFKYRLFDMSNGEQLARGGIDRIGGSESHCVVEIGDHKQEHQQSISNHAEAVGMCLKQLTDPQTGCLNNVEEVQGIGFKAVFAGKLSGIRKVDEELLEMMESLAPIAPAHNPPYARAMRELSQAFPQIPLVASLETAFHETIPLAHRSYAVPYEWMEDYHIRRWGFHGASHRFVSRRACELGGKEDLKVISCHLGGSSSICATQGGQSVATSMGMSPQSGLPQNNRVGDIDPFTLPVLMNATGKSLEELLVDLGNKSGLLGLSGLSGDCRDLEEAAAEGHQRAQLALDVFIAEIRRYIGGYMALLGGCDAVVFTGGIGENSQVIRAGACQNMDWAGMQLDVDLNGIGKGERELSSSDSRVKIWVIPTNEEWVVAQQTVDVLSGDATK